MEEDFYNEVMGFLHNDQLERIVHPIAERFVTQFDNQSIVDMLPETMLRFSSCTTGLALQRMFGKEMGTMQLNQLLAMITIFQLGMLAQQQIEAGTLLLPKTDQET